MLYSCTRMATVGFKGLKYAACKVIRIQMYIDMATRRPKQKYCLK